MVLKRETVIANVELILQTWNKHGVPLQDINHILSRRLKDNSFSAIFVIIFLFLVAKEKLDLSNKYEYSMTFFRLRTEFLIELIKSAFLNVL